MIAPVDSLLMRGGDARKRSFAAQDCSRPSKRALLAKQHAPAVFVHSQYCSQASIVDEEMIDDKTPAVDKHKKGKSLVGWHWQSSSDADIGSSRWFSPIKRVMPSRRKQSVSDSNCRVDVPNQREGASSALGSLSAAGPSRSPQAPMELYPPQLPHRTSSLDHSSIYAATCNSRSSSSRSIESESRKAHATQKQNSLARKASNQYAASTLSQQQSLSDLALQPGESVMDWSGTPVGSESSERLGQRFHYQTSSSPPQGNILNGIPLETVDGLVDWKATQSGFDSDAESAVFMTPEPEACHRHRSHSGMSQIARTDPAGRLPTELLIHILSYLDAGSLAAVALTSNQWAGLATDPNVQSSAFLGQWAPKSPSSPLPAPVGGRGIGKTRISTPLWRKQDWPSMHKARAQLERNWAAGEANKHFMFGHTDSVYCVQFDERKAITGSRDRTIRVWDLETYKCLRVIGGPQALWQDEQARAREPEYNNDMQAQLGAQGGLPDIDRSIYHVPEYYHPASILCLQYDDEIMVTGSSDSTLIVWDVKTFQPIRRLQKHSSGVLDLAFDADKIISCSKDFTICIWDRMTGDLLKQIGGHLGPVNAVQLRGNLLISASGEGTSHLYNLNFSRTRSPFIGQPDIVSVDPHFVKEFKSKERGLACVEFSDDTQTVLAGGNDHLIFRFSTNASSSKPQSMYRTRFAPPYVPPHLRQTTPSPFPASLMGNNNTHSTNETTSHGLQSSDSNSPPFTLASQHIAGHSSLVRSLYLDGANSRIISGSYDMSLKVWDFRSGDLLKTFPSLTTSWMLSAKSDYRRIVATSQDGRVVVLDFGSTVDGVDLLKGDVEDGKW